MQKRLQILSVVITLSSALTLCACQNSSSTNINNASPNRINLSDLSTPINIPPSMKNVKLTRGTYIFTLTKKETINHKKYIVYMTDKLSYTPEHKASPDDAYSKTLDIVSTNDKIAVRALESFKSAGHFEIKSAQDMSKAHQLVADSNHLNEVKFAIAILPANNSIKEKSKRIKEGNKIVVNGVRYELSKIINGDKEEPISHCLRMDVFYVTQLEIEK